jgi:hypothetical protein
MHYQEKGGRNLFGRILKLNEAVCCSWHNARDELLLKVRATQEQRLEAVGSMPLFGCQSQLIRNRQEQYHCTFPLALEVARDFLLSAIGSGLHK